MTDKLKLTGQERKEVIAELRIKHQPTFDALGIPEARYMPKLGYEPKGLKGLHMAFFGSELRDGIDTYTEMASTTLITEDPSRTLYKYRGNSHYQEELVSSDEEHNDQTRYFVPMDELEVIPAQIKRGRGRPRKTPVTDIDVQKTPIRTIKTVIVDVTEDAPMDAMTMRDYIAIHTGNPISAKKWINELLVNTK